MTVLDLSEDDATTLVAEVRALGADDAEYGRVGNLPEFKVKDAAPEQVLRALDHLRNSGRASKAHNKVRDDLLNQFNFRPLTYRLRSWEFTWEEQDQVFWSYTGEYVKGDRLVNGKGDAFTVFEVEKQATTTDAGALLVVRYQPT